MGVAGGLACVGNAPLSTFFVPTMVHAGVGLGAAGLLLVIASGLSLVLRVGAGAVVDRFRGVARPGIAIMLGVSTAGYVLMATKHPVVPDRGRGIAAYGGWAWTGMAFFLVLTPARGSAAAAAALFHAGFLTGMGSGPLQFGAALGIGGEPLAWSVTAGLGGARRRATGPLPVGGRGGRAGRAARRARRARPGA